jgi:hypothetical protein
MALVTFFNGNQGVYNYNNLQDFDPVTMTATSFRAEYNGGNGPYDPTQTPFAYEFVISRGQLYTFETGPRAGETTYVGGTITGVNYFDNTGKLLLSISEMKADLSYFMARLLRDAPYDMYKYFVQGGSTFNGSNNSSGLQSDWTGDDIDTGSGNDKVYARGGDDYIKDKGGVDLYDGGKGRDTITYDEWFWNPVGAKSGLVADLAKGTIRGPDGFVDTVKSIEDVYGTQFKDTILGTKGDNYFRGYQGRDFLDGREGFDTVSYRRDADRGGYDGIKADLAAGTVRDGFGHRDTIKNIEGVEGTDFNDTFVDNSRSNYFRGRDGNDTYTITRGNDFIDDWGGGADVFRFVGSNIGNNTIEGFDQDSGQRDRIFIDGVFDLGDVTITQDGSNAIIQAASGSIVLRDFNSANLSAADFQFDIA